MPLTKPIAILIVAVAAPLLAGAIYLVVPVFRPAAQALESQVDEHVERARRLVLRFGGNEARLAGVLRELREQGVDVADAERVERALEENRDVLDKINEEMGKRSKGPAVSRIRDIEERYKAADGEGSDNPLIPAANLGAGVPAVARAAREGIKARDMLLAENEKLLNDALGEVNAALAVSSGGLSAAQHAGANRMKGIILRAQAAALRRTADSTRRGAESRRAVLAGLIAESHSLDIEKQLHDKSEVQSRLESLHADAEGVRHTIDENKTRLDQLDRTIRDLETRITAFKDDANAARKEIEALEEKGAVLLDPAGAEKFAQQYDALAGRYRDAVSQAHRLEFGTLQNARIDDSGDYLAGAFVPQDTASEIRRERGLVDYIHDRETVNTDLTGLSETLKRLEEGVREYQALADQYRDFADKARRESDELRAKATVVFTEFEDMASQTDQTIEKSAKNAQAALNAFRTAANSASTASRDAQAALAPLSPPDQERSPNKKRSEDRWLPGQLTNESAQVRFLHATTLYQRFMNAAVDANIVEQSKSAFEIAQADPNIYNERRDAAKTEAITALRDAAADFEKSAKDLNTNWTIPAEAAAVHDLLALLEHPGHIQTAIENYQAAVAGRRDTSDTIAISQRLAQLRNRAGSTNN